jgi:hypothetical protein
LDPIHHQSSQYFILFFIRDVITTPDPKLHMAIFALISILTNTACAVGLHTTGAAEKAGKNLVAIAGCVGLAAVNIGFLLASNQYVLFVLALVHGEWAPSEQMQLLYVNKLLCANTITDLCLLCHFLHLHPIHKVHAVGCTPGVYSCSTTLLMLYYLTHCALYSSVEADLLCEVLPNNRRPHDLGGWKLSPLLGNWLGQLIGGVLLYHLGFTGHHEHYNFFGYVCVMLCAAVFAVLGALSTAK